jgi:hypothetical protein
MTMITERRRSQRYPVSFYIRLAIDDQIHRCCLTDLSCVGLYAQRPIQPLKRNSRQAQAEIRLPGTEESIWAGAELVYDRFDSRFHSSAYSFTALASGHRDLLRQWLADNRRRDRSATGSKFPPFGQVIVLRPERSFQRAA